MPSTLAAAPVEIVREATRVEWLAYTRTQAAEALGISRSTFNRRVLPLVETVEMPWGTHLIPVDELKRVMAERRRRARGRSRPAKPGRPAALPAEVVNRILEEHAEGKSLGQIARDLNARGTETAHGGERWWPSTVRAVVHRSSGAAEHTHPPTADNGGIRNADSPGTVALDA